MARRGSSRASATPPPPPLRPDDTPGTPELRVEVVECGPQSGPQEHFFHCGADITIYGGAAGGGKTWALLLEAMRWAREVRGYSAVIFRRTHPEIRNAGGMWDESFKLYTMPPMSGTPNLSRLEWTFPPYGNTITFAHMQHETDRFDWQGAQIPVMGFDELTTFTRVQFFFMLSRNRSSCGIRPYVRATCNPDADSWVAELIQWWIHPETGYPIPERAGVVRWFKRKGEEDTLVWADDEASLLDPDNPENRPLSLTFIPANVHDNAMLLANDPSYLTKLYQLPLVERERLLRGNWKIRPSSGLVFNRGWFDIIDEMPHPSQILARVRYWDKAGTPGSDSFAVGAKLAVTLDGTFIVEHIERGQWLAPERNRIMVTRAKQDGPLCFQWVEQEPGSGGKESAEITISDFAAEGIHTEAERVTGEKLARAEAMSWQAERRKIKLLRADWNERYLAELDRFPDGAHDDQVDASTGAFNKLRKLYDEIEAYGGLRERPDGRGVVEDETVDERDLPVEEIDVDLETDLYQGG